MLSVLELTAMFAVTELTDLTKISFLLFVIVFVLNLLPAFAPPTWTAMSFIGSSNPKHRFRLDSSSGRDRGY